MFGRRQPLCDDTSRMMREYQVRICERVGVKVPGPTRQNGGADRAIDASGVTLTPDVLGAVRPLLLRATTRPPLTRRRRVRLIAFGREKER
jgi:hypothetical protein